MNEQQSIEDQPAMCERCGNRLPSLTVEIEMADAPQSRFPLLAYGYVPYDDDLEHATMEIEVARSWSAGFDDPGTVIRYGGVHVGPFNLDTLAKLPSIRYPWTDDLADSERGPAFVTVGGAPARGPSPAGEAARDSSEEVANADTD